MALPMALSQSSAIVAVALLVVTAATRPPKEVVIRDEEMSPAPVYRNETLSSGRALLVQRESVVTESRSPDKRKKRFCVLPKDLQKRAECYEGGRIGEGGTCTVQCKDNEEWYSLRKNQPNYPEVKCRQGQWRSELRLVPRPACTVGSISAFKIVPIILALTVLIGCVCCCFCKVASVGEKQRLDGLRERYYKDMEEEAWHVQQQQQQQEQQAGGWKGMDAQYQGGAWGSAPTPGYGGGGWDAGAPGGGYGSGAPGGQGTGAPDLGFGSSAPGGGYDSGAPGGYGTSAPQGYGTRASAQYGGDWGQMR